MRKIIAAYFAPRTTNPNEPGIHILAVDYGTDEDGLWYSEHPSRQGYQPLDIPSPIASRALPLPARRGKT